MRAAEAGNREALPYLVDRLTDSERAVRMYAILALRRLTGQTLGYCYYDPPAERDVAVARWRRWLAKQPGAASRPSDETPQEGRP